MDLFTRYLPAQRERLRVLLQSPDWQSCLSRIGSIEAWQAGVRLPPNAPSQLAGASDYLIAHNLERVRAMIREGVTDPKTLARALGDWTAAETQAEFPLLFLGLVLTLECSFTPRCLYCNQTRLPQRMRLSDWKALIAEASLPVAPYVYLTGGEPLLRKEEVWGDDGLIAYAVERGCAVNINTNAALITPLVAMHLVRSGLSKVHISMDSADPQIQAELFGSPERVEAVHNGIFHLLIARELLGMRHPQIHINCVMTRKNLFQFPDLLRWILSIRKIRSAEEGRITDDPVFGDFAFHLIPVGGPDNAPLRPAQAEWERFYTVTWDEADRVWQDYQAEIGVPPGDRRTLEEQVPFANPFRRVEHHMSLGEYCAQAAAGVYWHGALGDCCHLAPSQAFVLPDGSQHWCGAHAIRRPAPLGNVLDAGLRENIRRNLERLHTLPVEVCASCAGATCVINQRMENRLQEAVGALGE